MQGGYCGVPAASTAATSRPAYAFDSIFGNLASTGGPTGHQLTTSWTIGAGIEHYWTPALRSSVFGNYNATTLQWHGADPVLLVSAEPDPHRGAALLRPALRRSPAATPTSTSGTSVRARSGTRCRTSMSASRSCTRSSRPSMIRLSSAFNFAGAGGRPVGLYAAVERGRVHRPVPHPAQLLAMIA